MGRVSVEAKERKREYMRNYQTRYREQHPNASRDWKRANPVRNRENHYKLPAGTLDLLYAIQKGECGICRCHLTLDNMHLDHIHREGVAKWVIKDLNDVRGLLCNTCNTGLGKLGDNEFGLERALVYVREG